MIGVLLGFVASLLFFVAVGVWSVTRAESSADDYLLAGRDVPAWLAALSSVATNNSGFMFVGLIGFTFRGGFHTVWMAVAWVLGDALAWWFVHPRVNARSHELQARSVPSLLAAPERAGRWVVIAAAVLTVVFLGGYAAAQLQAGSTALEELFGWPSWAGAVLGAAIVVVYCYSGGLRASIWTDAAQSMVMIVAMALLVAVAAWHVGGPLALRDALAAQDPALVSWTPPDATTGVVPYVLGFLAGGAGAIGQPHILVRTMSVASVAEIRRARRVYFAWFVPFYAFGLLVALYGRALMPELMVAPEGLAAAASQAHVVHATERAMPALAGLLLPDVLVGLILAGLFAATMSTADSQVLSCSASITEDLFPSLSGSASAPKLATLGVTALALGVALTASGGVFSLVLSAWAALGAALGPLVILLAFGRTPPTPVALSMMVAGLVTVFAWKETPWAGAVYALLPGMLVPLLLWGAARATGLTSASREADGIG